MWKVWPGSICRLRGVAVEWKLRRRRLAMPLGMRNSVVWRVRRTPWRARKRRATGRTWSAVRQLIGRRKRAFRPPAPMLGDDGKLLASFWAKANQHQRELMKEFGRTASNSARRNISPRHVWTSKRPLSSPSGGSRVRAHCRARSLSWRMLFALSPSPGQVVPAGLT